MKEEKLLEEPLLSKHNENVSFWSSLTFSWVNPLMKTGFRKQLCQDDLIPLPSDLDPGICRDHLWTAWIKTPAENKSLFWTIFSSYGWSFLFIGLLKVINDCLSFSGPLFLNAIVKSLQSEGSNRHGYWYACGLGGVSLLRGFLGTHYTFLVSRLRLKLKASLTTIIYRKAISIRLAERNSFSTGEIQTLMSVDADRTINLFSSVHDLWSLPMQMVVALCMLYMQVKYSFLAGLAVVVLLIPVNRWIAVKIGTANTFMMAEKDERIRRTNELLTHIYTVKMYAWEYLFANRIRIVRNEEVKYLSTRKYLDALCVYFWACTPTLFSVFTFGMFTLLGHTLDAATVFTSLALFNILISPLNSFPWVITGIVEARVSIKRLQRFLVCLDILEEQEYYLNTEHSQQECSSNLSIQIHGADFCWSIDEPPTLKSISLDVPEGSLVVILGQIGSGKTSLLHAILNEMKCTRGSIHVEGSVAFVSQMPWIRSETLRENILLGKPFAEERFNEALRACSLDIDVELMHDKDQSEIGERGFNLSGGQKARLALARAIYQDCDIYLLDDPLSAVDAHVATWLMQHAIQGPLLCKKTRILCTHHTQAASVADMIVIMENGYIKHMRGPKAKEPDLTEIEPIWNILVMNDSQESTPQENLSLVDEEARDQGRVKAAVYRSYAGFTGFWVVIVILLSTSLMQATKNGNDWWLAHWVDNISKHDQTSVKFYMKILFLIGALNSLFTLSRAFSFAYGGLRAALQVHETLLENILSAPVSFFEKNPVGRILNRFSSDLYTIDDSLPFIANILLAHWFSLLGILVVLCFVQWPVIVLLIPLGCIYYKIQKYYRETSREVRRLDSVSRSPIYTSFCEALEGASTIRAFQCQDMFTTKNCNYVEANQRASFSEIAASLWLSIRLQMMASFLVFFVSMLAMLSRDTGFSISSSTAGLVGLALSYAAPLISLLNDLLTAYAETEKEMVSVERVQQYLNVDSEESIETAITPHNWPHSGEIVFNNVKLVYHPELPPALDCLSFKIFPGEKVGVAGRTGAGKSSILAALFRIKHIDSGNILIDQINTMNIPYGKLRESLSVVPQNAFLFEGTVRENLDPTGCASDSLLWEVITKCHLKPALLSMGLDTHIRESGLSLSSGQRQLLCLARSLLKKSHILCLDECTANVDPETTDLLKETIEEECVDVTVVMIAHRISTISNLHRVFVMDRGKLVEQGDPKVLLSDSNSRFSNLLKLS